MAGKRPIFTQNFSDNLLAIQAFLGLEDHKLARFWNYEWQIPESGEHVIMVRATDGDGKSQSSKPGDLHSVTVDVV